MVVKSRSVQKKYDKRAEAGERQGAAIAPFPNSRAV